MAEEIYGDGTVSKPLHGDQTVQLIEPIEFGSETIEALELGAVKGKHLRKIQGADLSTGLLLTIAGWLSGKSDRVLDELSAPDIGNLIETLIGMLWPVGNLPKVDEATGRPPAPPSTPYTLKLSKEYRYGDSVHSELTFRGLKAKDVRGLDLVAVPVGKLVPMIETLTGAHKKIVDELEGVDLFKSLEVCQLFFLAIRPSGSAR